MQMILAHLSLHFPMPGTVLVEKLSGRVLERVLRLRELDQLLSVPGRMFRPPRVRPVRRMPRRNHCVRRDEIHKITKFA